MINAQDFDTRKKEIMNNNTLSDKMKSVELTVLMSNMATHFEIPLEYGNEYRKKNKETVLVFESIADQIKKLNSV